MSVPPRSSHPGAASGSYPVGPAVSGAHPDPWHGRARSTGSPVPGAVAALGGLLAALAAFLTWASVDAFGGREVTVNGLGHTNVEGLSVPGGGDGMITLAAGLLLAVVGVASVVLRRAGVLLGVLTLFPAVLIAAVGLYDRLRDPGIEGGYSYGIGLHLTILAGVLALVGAVLHLVLNRRV